VLVGSGGAAKAVLSRRGTLVYQSGQAKSQLMRVDRDGVGVPITTVARAFRHPRYSPDGSRIAVTVRSPQSSDIWLCTVATGAMSRLTAAGDNDFAEWSGDGKRIVYHSVQGDGKVGLRWLAVDGSESGVLAKTGDDPNGAVLSADGRSAVFRTAPSAGKRRAIVAQDLATGETHEVIPTSFREIGPRFSPDGRWIAYMSDESGGIEVMVAPMGGAQARVRVSTDGGTEPQWSRDGKTLYYKNNRSLMAASFAPGSPPTISNRTRLFASTYLSDPTDPDYDIAPDGRFVMLQAVADDALTVVVLGWERDVAAMLKTP
jgi:Tol biopolymer transport system component